MQFLDDLVVASCNHVWLIVAMVVFDEVHAVFLVGVEAEVRCGVGNEPVLTVRSGEAVAKVLVPLG